MLEAMQSLRDKIKSVKKTSEAGVDQISTSDPKPGTSKQTDDLPPHPNIQPNTRMSPWRQSSVGLPYHLSSVRMSSPSSDQI